MLRLLLALVAVYALTAYGGRGFEEPADMGEDAALPATTPPLSSGFEEPSEMSEDAALPATTPPPSSSGANPIDDILERSRPELLALPGVVGTGHGRTQDGADAIIIWVTDPGAAEHVPTEIEGYPVIVNTVPGGFRAYEG
jgi:hypothetical protein